MKTLTLIVAFTSVALAADPPKEKPKPPAISPQHLAEYYRADGVLARVQQGLKEAQEDLQKAVTDIVGDCGAKFNPAPEGKTLVCAAKPEPEPAKEAFKPVK